MKQMRLMVASAICAALLMNFAIAVADESMAAASAARATAKDDAADGPFLVRQIEVQLEEALADLSRFGALGAVLVIDSPDLGRISAVSGYVDTARSQGMDGGKGFQIGSQTKMFTAASVLLLARDGALSIDDPVSRYVPDIGGLEGITVRHLLTHTSGLGDGVAVMDVPKPPPAVAVTFRDIVFLSALEGPRFAPGARFDYNNFGFDILGAVIESITGEPVSRFVRSRILEPLQMADTYVGSDENWPAARMAHAYWTISEKLEDVTGPRDLSYAYTAGDMVSTAPDMLKWLQALATPGNPVGLAMRDFVISPVNVGEAEMPRYGFGMMFRNFGGREVLGHGGFIQGYMSYSGIVSADGTRFSMMMSLDGSPDTDYRLLKFQLTAAIEEGLAMARIGERVLNRGEQP